MSAMIADAEEEKSAGTGGTGAAASATTAPAMGSHAAKGFTFMLAQGLGTRVIAFACQMWLSYILLPEHFGTMAIADSIAMFANLLQMIGVREILVSRQKRFHLWSNAGFWIMTGTGWTTAALLAVAAPFVSRAYGNADLLGLILVIALSIPLYSMGAVSEAKLQIQLRFKYLALIAAVWATIIPVLTVVFALLGFGAYSFVLPRVIAAVVRLVMAQRGAKLDLKWNPQFRRWRFIVGTSVLVFFTSMLLLVAQIGDRPLLSLFVGQHEVGLYAFAFAFSLQTIMMIAVNLQQVLFATLAKLNDERERQLAAFLRASRVLAAVVTPICVIQSVASEPLVRTVFAYEKWKDSVPAMQALALGMVFLGSYCPSSAMLEAQRRFRAKFKLALVNAVGYSAAVIVGIWLGDRGVFGRGGPLGAVDGTAIAVAATLAVMSPLWSYITTRTLGGGLRDTLGIVARPLVASGLAAGAGVLAARAAGSVAAGQVAWGVHVEHWVRLVVLCGVASLAYVPLMRVLMPREFAEIGRKVVAIARRASPRAAGVMARVAGV